MCTKDIERLLIIVVRFLVGCLREMFGECVPVALFSPMLYRYLSLKLRCILIINVDRHVYVVCVIRECIRFALCQMKMTNDIIVHSIDKYQIVDCLGILAVTLAISYPRKNEISQYLKHM